MVFLRPISILLVTFSPLFVLSLTLLVQLFQVVLGAAFVRLATGNSALILNGFHRHEWRSSSPYVESFRNVSLVVADASP